MTSTAICYVTDPDFLFPTIVSAISVRQVVSRSSADCLIYIAADDFDVGKLDPIAARTGVQFLPCRSPWRGAYKEDQYHHYHVPPAALGRVLLADMLPAKINRFLYLDGDTLISGDLKSLLELQTGNSIAACEDMMSFCRDDATQFARESNTYYSKIGVDRQNGYFNSGVIVSNVDAWRRIAPLAFDFFRANTVACRYHDQSALNAVAQKDRKRLSIRWNYQKQFRQWRYYPNDITIDHFAGSPKPWMGRFPPLTSFTSHYASNSELIDVYGINSSWPNTKILATEWVKHYAKLAYLSTLRKNRLTSRINLINAYQATCVL